MKDKIRNENRGFTLIELVITIAVLAVISVPLLMYFTDSMRHSARMKEEQNAVVAAQNVLEELKVVDMSLDTPDYLTQAVTPPPGATPFPTTSVTWSLSATSSPDPAATPASSVAPDSSYTVQGQYKLNKQVYTVQAKITPRSELENFNGDIKVYRKAQAPSMNSAKDMVITERSSTIEDAKLDFYHQYTKACDASGQPRDASITIDSLERCLERTIHIRAEKEVDGASTATGKVVLTVSYEYKWKSSEPLITGITSATTHLSDIKTVILDGTGAHNILLFYTPLHYQTNPTSPTSPTVVMDDTVILEGNLAKVTKTEGMEMKVLLGDAGTGSDDLQYNLYLVADAVDRSAAPTYKTFLKKVASDNFGTYISAVYTNLKNSELDPGSYAINAVFPSASEAGHGFHYEKLLENPEVNRLAEIEVSVYKGDSTSENNCYTTVNGTKVQSY